MRVKVQGGVAQLKGPEIVVYLRSMPVTLGAADWRGLHQCDYRGAGVPFADLSALEDRYLPPDVMALLFSVRAASQVLCCPVRVVDLGQMGLSVGGSYRGAASLCRAFPLTPVALRGHRQGPR